MYAAHAAHTARLLGRLPCVDSSAGGAVRTGCPCSDESAGACAGMDPTAAGLRRRTQRLQRQSGLALQLPTRPLPRAAHHPPAPQAAVGGHCAHLHRGGCHRVCRRAVGLDQAARPARAENPGGASVVGAGPAHAGAPWPRPALHPRCPAGGRAPPAPPASRQLTASRCLSAWLAPTQITDMTASTFSANLVIVVFGFMCMILVISPSPWLLLCMLWCCACSAACRRGAPLPLLPPFPLLCCCRRCKLEAQAWLC